MEIKAVVLLSGGLDSVFNLYEANRRWPGQVLALNINYGQRAYESEKRAAQYFADDLKLPVQVLDLSSVFSFDKSSLTSDEKEVPTDSVDIASAEASQESAKKVWVSNRNGVLLNVAACLAESLGASIVIPGFNAEEAATFPDNSVEYIEKMNASLKMSTSNAVQIQCFSQEMDKAEIVSACLQLGVDLDSIWSCYFPGEKPCGKCESCQRLKRARDLNETR